MFRFAAYLREKARAAALGELLLWCLPALLVALALRVALTAALPYAFYHDDTTDFIQTADKLIYQDKFEIHEKKSYLSPLLLTLPFFSGLPAMTVIPVAQHISGILVVLMVGALCRLWLAHWKLFIVPVTLLVAANPALLWFEHTPMAEPHFIFAIVLLALAGTLYAHRQSTGRFALLCAALLLVTGARPEGKLMFGFGALLLAMLHWRDWRAHVRRFAAFLVLAAASCYLARTSQSALLLYTSVARFTPPDLRCAPGFEPYIAPMRAKLQAKWEQMRGFPNVSDRKEISRQVKLYLTDQAEAKGRARRDSDEAFCLAVAKETCLRNLGELPAHTLYKFRYHASESPAPVYDEFFVFVKQRKAMLDRADLIRRQGRRLFGCEFSSDEEVERFLLAAYREVPWFNMLSHHWYETVSALRLPDAAYTNPNYPAVPFIYRGLPYYMLAAAAGLLLAVFRPGWIRRFHIAWGLSLLAFAFIVLLTANVRARFRLFLEPFWFLYIALLVDLALWGLLRLRRKS